MKLHTRVTRKAILIGCPSEGRNYLYGVSSDLTNMKNHFSSKNGGEFFPSEIITLENPSAIEVYQTIQSNVSDYQFIYFSGHGATNAQTGERILSLRDCCISDTSLLNESPRQLVVIDSCRTHVTPGLAGLPEEEKHWLSANGLYPIHDLFDSLISNSPFGKVIVHATLDGETSDDSQWGGLFTRAVLKVSKNISDRNNREHTSIYSIVNNAAALLKKQTPEIVFTEGDFNIPFCLGIKSEEKKIDFRKIKKVVPVNAGVHPIVWVSLSLLAIAILTSD